MNNQVILLFSLILPWLSLLFVQQRDIKRYITVGLLSTLLSIIVTEIGIKYGWWRINETIFPSSVLPTYSYGLFPIIPIWVFKLTYGNFKRYIIFDTILNFIFAYVILPWLGNRGMIDFEGRLQVFVFATTIAIIIYIFQIWFEIEEDR